MKRPAADRWARGFEAAEAGLKEAENTRPTMRRALAIASGVGGFWENGTRLNQGRYTHTVTGTLNLPVWPGGRVGGLYVDITPISEVAVYRYDQHGVVSFVRAVPDSGKAPCWAVVNHAGTHLYATNTGDNSISVFDLTDPLSLVEIQHFIMDDTTGAPFSTVIDSSDQFLYVSSEQKSANATPAANAFHTLKIDANGTLSEPFSPTVLPMGGTVPVRAQGITVVGAN